MDRKQRIIMLVIIGGGIATILGAWWLAQRPQSDRAAFEARPFRAQPGTEREQRLEFDTPPATAPSGQAPDPDSSVPEVPVAETPAAEESAGLSIPDEVTEAATEAMMHPDPEVGLDTIAAALATASLAEASDLYAAAGTLYLQRIPPDEDAAHQVFERAIDTAAEPRQAHGAAVQLAGLLVNQGQPGEALVLLGRVMPASVSATTPSRAAVRLRLFQGGLFQDAGDSAKALACFEDAWENARVIYLAVGDDDAAAVYRQASLALARHHRYEGSHEASDHVLTQMRATLGER